MRSRIFKLTLLFVLLGTADQITAQAVTARATTNIISALSLTKAEGEEGDLDWGDIIAGSTTSTVYLSPDETGMRSINDPGATLASSNTGNAAKFILSGKEDASVDISLSSPNIILDDGIGNSMNATLSISKDLAILAEGVAEIYVGGTLTVEAEQPLGYYSGYFELNAQYQ